MREKSLKITDFLAFTVFTVFAVCLLLLMLTGARVYGDLVEKGSDTYRERTAAMYLSTRVRQSRNLTLEDFHGCQALTERQEIDGETYLLRVYCYEGSLWELFCAQGAQLMPEDGEKILEARSVVFSLEEGLLTAELNGRKLLFELAGKEVPR